MASDLSAQTSAITIGDGSPCSPMASATVLMLRDAPQGLEVYLLKRHGLSEVLGGAYVFPGGKLDRQDVALIDRLDRPPVQLHEALGEPQLSVAGAAALHVAAIREVFEEAGVLFAAFPSAGIPRDLATLRAEQRFDRVVELAGAPLAASCLVPWSRWITPVASMRARKHFDARFFVAVAPPGQEPAHDQDETTDGLWLKPQLALQEYWEGRIQLAAPQIMTLAHLSRYPDVAGTMAYARSRRPVCIHPEVVEEDGTMLVCYPGDTRHSLQSPVMPGPTRLRWRNDRYEPDKGLKALLG